MRIILANPRGFCAGVIRAINIVKKAISIYGIPIYVKHELVHNDYVIKELLNLGVVFVEDLDDVPNGSVLIFSAHGVSRAVKKQSKDKELIVLDATCPLVSKVHMKVLRASKKEMEIILIGHAGHPEVSGIIGQYEYINNTDRSIYLVQSKKDAWSIKVNYPDNLSYVTQTTLSIDDTVEIIEILKRRFPRILAPKKNDICYATSNRQVALKKLALLTEVILIVGSKQSSNSNRLLELAYKIGKPAYLISDASYIQVDWICNVNTIGITAGASTPEILVEQVIDRLRMISLCDVVVEHMIGKQENMFFDIPQRLQ
ncbi:4-hydroxy-3-methylbut-2-enyl diphosphate reductase [Candidatus Blochmanniella vafra]|uniref:4-hydroxy-3-methylbut-2-enyl diphosphate reductase n=1 Tax=Candidatus Blochmanniella vafra TaxID=251535 RepID=UPI0005C624B8|nr:4-hydroxy-3-methylbut-2-enyl diphosphate reductase [Candidatus Blochmannia vafer]